MKYVIFFLVILSYGQIAGQEYKNSLPAYAKDTIYEDEHNNIIDTRLFDFKLNSTLFYAYKFEDSKTVLFKLRYSHLFGALEATKKVQLFKLLTSRNKVDTTKIMVIHYQDTLKRIVDFPKENTIIFNKDSTSHRHLNSHNEYIRQQKNCLKEFKRNKKTNVYHYFRVNLGHPLKFGECSWQKDNFGLIDALFRDDYKRFQTIVIHPDGKFYCFNLNDHGKNRNVYNDIIKDKNWDEHQEEFLKNLRSLNSL